MHVHYRVLNYRNPKGPPYTLQFVVQRDCVVDEVGVCVERDGRGGGGQIEKPNLKLNNHAKVIKTLLIFVGREYC